MGDFSTFLFAKPSASEGAGRILDFGNTLFTYNTSLTPEQADHIALTMDGFAIGRDLHHAIEEHGVGTRKQIAKAPAAK